MSAYCRVNRRNSGTRRRCSSTWSFVSCRRKRAIEIALAKLIFCADFDSPDRFSPYRSISDLSFYWFLFVASSFDENAITNSTFNPKFSIDAGNWAGARRFRFRATIRAYMCRNWQPVTSIAISWNKQQYQFVQCFGIIEVSHVKQIDTSHDQIIAQRSHVLQNIKTIFFWT